KRRVESTFEAMGTNMLIIQPGSTQSGGVRGGGGTGSTLTWTDLKAIQKVPTVKIAVPQLSARAQVITDYGNWNTQVRGTTPEYFDVRNWPMSSGSRFGQSDVDTGTKVIVLGQTVVDNAFGPGSDPVG